MTRKIMIDDDDELTAPDDGWDETFDDDFDEDFDEFDEEDLEEIGDLEDQFDYLMNQN